VNLLKVNQTKLDCCLSANLIVVPLWVAATDRTLTGKLHFCNSEDVGTDEMTGVFCAGLDAVPALEEEWEDKETVPSPWPRTANHRTRNRKLGN
jgi:hypothetical protein